MREIKLAFSNSVTESLPLQLHSKYRITNREVMSISNIHFSIKLRNLVLKQEVTFNFSMFALDIMGEQRKSFPDQAWESIMLVGSETMSTV